MWSGGAERNESPGVARDGPFVEPCSGRRILDRRPGRIEDRYLIRRRTARLAPGNQLAQVGMNVTGRDRPRVQGVMQVAHACGLLAKIHDDLRVAEKIRRQLVLVRTIGADSRNE